MVKKMKRKLHANKKIVRAAEMFLAAETAFGLVATVATVGAWIALGHPLIGVLCAVGYLAGAAAKLIIGIAAH